MWSARFWAGMQLEIRTEVYETKRAMDGAEFIRRIRRLGRERSVEVRFEARHGKGSHGRLYYGDRFTTLKDRKKEIGTGLLRAMLGQLGLSMEDLEK